MSNLSVEERERSKVVLSEVFPETNIVVESPAVPLSAHGEGLLIFGASEWVSVFLSNLSGLLGKGDERYFWSGVRPLNDSQLVLSMLEKEPDKKLPRLELLQRLFLLDLLRYSSVQVNRFCRLTVLTRNGSIIHTSLVETPSLSKGEDLS